MDGVAMIVVVLMVLATVGSGQVLPYQRFRSTQQQQQQPSQFVVQPSSPLQPVNVQPQVFVDQSPRQPQVLVQSPQPRLAEPSSPQVLVEPSPQVFVQPTPPQVFVQQSPQQPPVFVQPSLPQRVVLQPQSFPQPSPSVLFNPPPLTRPLAILVSGEPQLLEPFEEEDEDELVLGVDVDEPVLEPRVVFERPLRQMVDEPQDLVAVEDEGGFFLVEEDDEPGVDVSRVLPQTPQDQLVGGVVVHRRPRIFFPRPIVRVPPPRPQVVSQRPQVVSQRPVLVSQRPQVVPQVVSQRPQAVPVPQPSPQVVSQVVSRRPQVVARPQVVQAPVPQPTPQPVTVIVQTRPSLPPRPVLRERDDEDHLPSVSVEATCDDATLVDQQVGLESWHLSWCHQPGRTFTWQGARDYCTSLGSGFAPVSVDTPNKNAFISAVMSAHGRSSTWTSGYRASASSAWVWGSGELFSYTNWASTGSSGGSGSASNAPGTDLCLAVRNSYTAGASWHDEDCSFNTIVICATRL